MNHQPIDRHAIAYDFRAVRRLDDRELARFLAERESDPVDMTFIEAEWQRRQRRTGRAEGSTLAALALLVSAAALGVSGYTAFVRPRAPQPAAVAVAGTGAPPALAYAIDEPPFPQRGKIK